MSSLFAWDCADFVGKILYCISVIVFYVFHQQLHICACLFFKICLLFCLWMLSTNLSEWGLIVVSKPRIVIAGWQLYVQLKQKFWFSLQTTVLQNLLGYLSLDPLRRTLLLRVRFTEVSHWEQCALCVSMGGQFWCFSQTLFAFMRMREAQPYPKWAVISYYLVNCLPSSKTSEAWVLTVVPCPLSFSASSVTLFMWLGTWQQGIKLVDSCLFTK